MKTKRTLITVLTAALLVSAALIIGCSSPGDGMSPDQGGGGAGQKNDNFQIPPGKGVIRINVSDKNSRTVLPDNTVSGIRVEDMVFDIVFTGVSNNLNWPGTGTYLNYTQLTNIPISLVADTYDILLTAYEDAIVKVPIAGWSAGAPDYPSGGYQISSGGDETATANLIGFTNGNAEGKFSYSFNVPAGSYTASALVINGTTKGSFTDGATIPLNPGTTTANADYSLPSGYYIVRATFSQTDHITKQYMQAVHIYPAMTSKWILSLCLLL